MNSGWVLPAIAAVVVATAVVGAWGTRVSRTTSDFLVASRTVSSTWNASAIGGEYLSAASFLGVAGLVMVYGVDMLWYPVGFVAGYFVLLVVVAAPLRRSGAYTLPDFAEARLGSRSIRRLAGVLVVLIGWLYTLPQLQGAGLTLRALTGAPRWSGSAMVAVVVTGTVAAGGMRSITFVQGFQYWLKLFALAVPAIFLVAVWHLHGAATESTAHTPTFRADTTVVVRATTAVQVASPTTVLARGVVDGEVRDGPVLLGPGRHTIAVDTRVTFTAGTAVPHAVGVPVQDNARWAAPMSVRSTSGHPLYATYSLIIATFLGTMGLPHVLVRFYTNPDGRSARRTTLGVIALLGLFYLFPAIYGALGRVLAPELLLTGQTDTVVLVLPGLLVPGLGGQLLGALVAAGAFAAFLSTSSGLIMSIAGVLGQDLLRGTVRSFRQAAVLAAAVPLALSLIVTQLPVSEVVAMAFAVAASSFCPLLLLGIWWRGLTDVGAAAGLLVGGGSAIGAVTARIAGWQPAGFARDLLAQPAAWTVPLAFLVMVVVSRATRSRVPVDVDRILARLHVPEALRLDRLPS